MNEGDVEARVRAAIDSSSFAARLRLRRDTALSGVGWIFKVVGGDFGAGLHAITVGPFGMLLLFNREGDCLAAKLRPGNVHSAEGWEELLLPEIERQQHQDREVAIRADAAFAKPELYAVKSER